MPVFYIDTSALVKRYRTEQGTGVVEVLLSDPRPEDRFFLSFLSVIELTSGILRLGKHPLGGGIVDLAQTLDQAVLIHGAYLIQDDLSLLPVKLQGNPRWISPSRGGHWRHDHGPDVTVHLVPS